MDFSVLLNENFCYELNIKNAFCFEVIDQNLINNKCATNCNEFVQISWLITQFV